MTQDEIIEMANKAGANVHFSKHHIKFLEAFAKLVALRYEKKIADLENIIAQRHWDVLQEREALLDTVYSYAKSLSWNEDFQADIRARGHQ